MRRFWCNETGNVAILFALAIVPVIGGVGAAVDYSMASGYRSNMQKSIDATALALSKIMPASDDVLNEKATQYFKASMGEDNLARLEPWSVEVLQADGAVTISAKGYYKPALVRVLGVDSFQIGTEAIAKWNLGKVEVVLALDNTGSMAPNQKLEKLKEGAQKLVDILKSAARKEGDAKVGIVPFAVQVKVDAASNMTSSWLRTDTNLKVCISRWTGKLTGHMTKSSCKASYSRIWTNVASNNSNWTGCIADRDKDTNLNYDVKDTEVTSTSSTKFPRTLGCGSLATILPLTDVFTSSGYDAITNKISAMQADGNTNVTIGAAWGWHLLDDKIPFSEGVPYQTKDVQKYLILMTDGDNTQNRFTTSQSAIDARTEAVCSNIKALPLNTANSPPTPAIKVWTIRLIDGNEELLKKCATDETMYISVTDPNQLSAVFTAIGSEIASLHLAK